MEDADLCIRMHKAGPSEACGLGYKGHGRAHRSHVGSCRMDSCDHAHASQARCSSTLHQAFLSTPRTVVHLCCSYGYIIPADGCLCFNKAAGSQVSTFCPEHSCYRRKLMGQRHIVRLMSHTLNLTHINKIGLHLLVCKQCISLWGP
eukprot:scaffold226776_cov17-Tisochrysis_lutea.AAC.1